MSRIIKSFDLSEDAVMQSQNLQQEMFEKLKDIVERAERPHGETDDDLIVQIRDAGSILRDDQILHIVSSAIQQYDEAITRNQAAMHSERQRLLQQIAVLNGERLVIHNGGYQQPRRQGQIDVLRTVVLQRVRLDEDTAELRGRSG